MARREVELRPTAPRSPPVRPRPGRPRTTRPTSVGTPRTPVRRLPGPPPRADALRPGLYADGRSSTTSPAALRITPSRTGGLRRRSLASPAIRHPRPPRCQCHSSASARASACACACARHSLRARSGARAGRGGSGSGEIGPARRRRPAGPRRTRHPAANRPPACRLRAGSRATGPGHLRVARERASTRSRSPNCSPPGSRTVSSPVRRASSPSACARRPCPPHHGRRCPSRDVRSSSVPGLRRLLPALPRPAPRPLPRLPISQRSSRRRMMIGPALAFGGVGGWHGVWCQTLLPRTVGGRHRTGKGPAT